MPFIEHFRNDAILAAAIAASGLPADTMANEIDKATYKTLQDGIHITAHDANPHISLSYTGISISWPPELSTAPHVAKCPQCNMDHGAGFYYDIDRSGARMSIIDFKFNATASDGIIGLPLSRVIDVPGARLMTISKIMTIREEPEFCIETLLWVQPSTT